VVAAWIRIVTVQNATLVSLQDLQRRLTSLDEDQLIDLVAVPLLRRMGYANVERVTHHGPGEAGIDIEPFYETNKLGQLMFSGAQTKTKRIHKSAGQQAGELRPPVSNPEKHGNRCQFSDDTKDD